MENKLIGPIKVNFQMFNFNNDKFETKQETNQHEFLSKEQTKKLDDELKKTVHIFIIPQKLLERLILYNI